MRDFIWVIIIGVILIIGIVFLAIALKFYKDYLACSNEYSPWCYADWVCSTYPNTNPNRYPAKVAYAAALACTEYDKSTGLYNYICDENGKPKT